MNWRELWSQLCALAFIAGALTVVAIVSLAVS